MGVIKWLYSSNYSMEGGQMAMLVSLLYGGGGEVWEPEGNGYTRLTTTLWSLSMCRGVSQSGIQHQACVVWSDGYTRLIILWRVVRWLYSSHCSMVGWRGVETRM